MNEIDNNDQGDHDSDGSKSALFPYIAYYSIAPTAQQSTKPEVKPWIVGNSSWKPKLRWDTQLALYKCMQLKCTFSTNDTSKMRAHIDSHLKIIAAAKVEKNFDLTQQRLDCLMSFGECAYCDIKPITDSMIVDHTAEKHSNSKYQCAQCFYRTVKLENLISHNEHHHSNKRQLLICPEADVVREIHKTDLDAMYDDFENSCHHFELRNVPCTRKCTYEQNVYLFSRNYSNYLNFLI